MIGLRVIGGKGICGMVSFRGIALADSNSSKNASQSQRISMDFPISVKLIYKLINGSLLQRAVFSYQSIQIIKAIGVRA
jgi:hypothetical protein